MELRYGTAHQVGAPNPGRRHFGVPPGGAFDRYSHSAANLLVGHEPNQPVWELAVARATFECTADSLVAIVGAESGFQIDGNKLSSNRSILVSQGQMLTLDAPRLGARQYIASNAASAMSPRVLEVPPSVFHRHSIAITLHRPELIPRDWKEQPLTVSGSMNRMGIRLPWFEGFRSTSEETSRPVDFGQIQLTADGTAIILGPDGPTIGGYPIVASVHPAHLSRLAQWTPGLKVWLTDSPGEPFEERTLARLRIGLRNSHDPT